MVSAAASVASVGTLTAAPMPARQALAVDGVLLKLEVASDLGLHARARRVGESRHTGARKGAARARGIACSTAA